MPSKVEGADFPGCPEAAGEIAIHHYRREAADTAWDEVFRG
jgi:hypothetical protein